MLAMLHWDGEQQSARKAQTMWQDYLGGAFLIIMGISGIWLAISIPQANKAASRNADDPERRLWMRAERWLWMIGFGLPGLGFICLGILGLRYSSGLYIQVPASAPWFDQALWRFLMVGIVAGFFGMGAWAIANSVAKAQQGAITYERPQSGASSAFESTGEENNGQLLARSATTGWLDWFHGELWLFPQGLLRIPIGVAKTLLLRGYIPVSAGHMRVFSASEFASQISNPRNLWIPVDQIETARLGHTLGADELRVMLRDGRTFHLLWLPSEQIFQLLQERIHEWGLAPR
jgi:hypothetical protein